MDGADRTHVAIEPGRTRAVAEPAALSVGVGLAVIAVLLSVSLPATHSAPHWSLVWTGLDLASGTTALLTWALLRGRDPRAALTAVVGAALLAVDAWFDVCTASPGTEYVIALTEACVVELPLAALAVHLGLHVLRDQR